MTDLENQSNDVELWDTAPILLAFVTAIALGTILDDHVGAVMIWGGTKCEVMNGVYGCFGYAPAGIVALIVGCTVVFSLVDGLLRGDE